jgi:hypothetical protein
MRKILCALENYQRILLIQDDTTIDNYNLFICKNYFTILKEKYENIKLSDALLILERDYGVKELFEVNRFLEAVNKERNLRLVVEDGGGEWKYCFDVIDLRTGKSTDDWACKSMEQLYLQASDYGVTEEDFKEIDFNKIPLAE